MHGLRKLTVPKGKVQYCWLQVMFVTERESDLRMKPQPLADGKQAARLWT